MLGPNQIWARRNPVGGDDLWDQIRIVGTFEGEFTITSNVGFTEVISALAESIVEYYEPVSAAEAPGAWQTPERALARHA